MERYWGNQLGKKTTPLSAIKNFCLECQGGCLVEWEDVDGNHHKPYRPHNLVTECIDPLCWLYPYRKGTGNRKKVSGAQRKRKATSKDGATVP